MKKRLLLVVALVTLPMAAWGQGSTPLDCPECLLSIWDDAALTTNYGTITQNVMKDIYLGFRVGPGETGFTTFEFSVHGMSAAEGIFITNTVWLTSAPPNVTIGTIHAPADTSQGSVQTGGWNVGWQTCQEIPTGETQVAYARITLLATAPLLNKVFTVLHKFPTSNVNYAFRPVFTRCDAPEFTAVVPRTGCYVANWDGVTDLSCDQKTGVSEANWGAVKQLFR